MPGNANQVITFELTDMLGNNRALGDYVPQIGRDPDRCRALAHAVGTLYRLPHLCAPNLAKSLIFRSRRFSTN